MDPHCLLAHTRVIRPDALPAESPPPGVRSLEEEQLKEELKILSEKQTRVMMKN